LLVLAVIFFQLGMILNETLRLYPPAVATIRRAKFDVTLGGGGDGDAGGIHIPRDTELLVPIMAIHHDARLWGPDAAQFNPARFASGAARAAKHPLAFIPFGLGSRMCIGQSLAILEAKRLGRPLSRAHDAFFHDIRILDFHPAELYGIHPSPSLSLSPSSSSPAPATGLVVGI
jgi:cytochrome P450